MGVLLVTSDLMTSSRVAGLAKSLGISLDVAENFEQTAQLAEGGTHTLAVLDLNSSAAANSSQLISRLRELSPSLRIVAFGPHVHERALQAAQEAGCDEVLSRGQFFAQLECVLRSAI
jgi:DNA-binding NarL/FixJ family response regulator